MRTRVGFFLATATVAFAGAAAAAWGWASLVSLPVVFAFTLGAVLSAEIIRSTLSQTEVVATIRVRSRDCRRLYCRGPIRECPIKNTGFRWRTNPSCLDIAESRLIRQPPGGFGRGWNIRRDGGCSPS